MDVHQSLGAGSGNGLERYMLRDIRETGKEIGRGSHATVVELDYKGLRCVGKKIHSLLYVGQETIHLRRFKEECRLLSQLSHPHIVQFLGVYLEEDTKVPALVMEFLPTNLTQCLDHYGIMADEISFSILRDVSLGLRYLHERDNPIIHRDLSANNVLLTSDMNAKISDLGVAKIIEVNPFQQQTMSKAPGTSCYMPPEVLSDKPHYDFKVDTFSFGVMVVHVLSGQWPFPCEAVRTTADNPSNLHAVSEFDRRASTIQIIKDTHPLIPLVKQCLSNSPSLRPTALDVHQRVSTVADSCPPSFVNRAVMLETIKVVREEKEVLRIEKENSTLEKDVIINERDIAISENAALTLQIEKVQGEMTDLMETNKLLHRTIQEKVQETDEKVHKMLYQEAILVSKVASLKNELDHALAVKDLNLFSKDAKLSVTKCATIDVVTKPLTIYTNRVVCMGNGVYIGYTYSTAATYMGFGSIPFGPLHYCCDTDMWRCLPLPPVKEYNLGCIFEKLLVVGGHKVSDVYEFNETSQQWIKSTSVPPMPTARSHATVATWTAVDMSALIVCGGKDRKSNTVDVVEVYHSVTAQWHTTAPSLPLPRHSMRYSMHQNTLYLLGGEKVTQKSSVFCVSVPDLLESLFQQPSSSDSDQDRHKWQTLPDVPSTCCLPVNLNDCLLAVERRKAVVYGYCPPFSTWVKLGNIPFLNTFEGVLTTEARVIVSMKSNELLVIDAKFSVTTVDPAASLAFSVSKITVAL